jgi:hypothetical protein
MFWPCDERGVPISTIDEKVCASMKKFLSKEPKQCCKNHNLNKEKVRREWNKSCVEVGLPCHKLKSPMKMDLHHISFVSKNTWIHSSINICYQHSSL